MYGKKLKQEGQRKAFWALTGIILAGIVLICAVTGVVFQIANAQSEDFSMSLRWIGEGVDPNALTLNSSRPESQLARLRVSYSRKVSEAAYEPEQLIITVSGLGGVSRDGSYDRVGKVAADLVTTTNKEYDWSYSYDASSDTYTFFNNFRVEPNSPFEGSFELVWELPSRETVHEFQKTVGGSLRTTLNERVTANNVTFKQTRTKDEYTVELRPGPVYSAEGLDDGLDASQYHWIKYDVLGTLNYSARGIQAAEKFRLWVREDALIRSTEMKKTSMTKTIGGKKYECWEMDQDITNESINPYLPNIYVAYPESRYSADDNIAAYVEIVGTYHEESTLNILAENSCTLRLGDYEYYGPPGDIYDMEKYMHGITGAVIDQHCEACKRYEKGGQGIGCVNAEHIWNSKREYYTDLWVQLNYRTTDAEYYDIELVDDFMDIILNNGDYHLLQDGEYHFTKAQVPANTQILNINGIPIKANKYKVEIYARAANTTTFVQFAETYITDEKQVFNVPANTSAVKFIIRGMTESMRMGPYTEKKDGGFGLYYLFHANQNTDIRTNGGQINNNAFIKLYNERGWANNIFGPEHYSDKWTYDRDMATYGSALDREKGSIHILEVPNELEARTYIAQTGETNDHYYFNAGLGSYIFLGEGSSVDKFSMYTILPEGLYLANRYKDPDALLDAVQLSQGTFYGGAKLSEAFLRRYCTLEVIDNYKGSGRTYLGFHFAFPEGTVVDSAQFNIRGIPLYLPKDSLESNSVFYMTSMSLIDDKAGAWHANRTDNWNTENGIWRDIDRDNDVTEVAASAQTSLTIYWADFGSMQSTKLVQTELTDGFIQPPKITGTQQYDPDGMAYTYQGREYQYRLRLRTHECEATKIIFYDALETGPLKEWQGNFLGFDFTEAMKVLGTNVQPKVYYSTAVEFTRDANGKLTSEPNFSTGSWTTTKPAGTIRSIAIDFGTAKLAEGTYLPVVVKMRAPADSGALNGKITENNFSVYYDKIDLETGHVLERQGLHSNDVPVEMSPYMGMIYMYKVDGTSTEPLAGAEFDFYQQMGASPNPATDKKLYTGLVTDESGRIRIEKLTNGKYYFVETKAPTGYEMASGVSEIITISDADAGKIHKLYIENPRKTGGITIKKVSDRNANTLLPGAVFSVYKEDGTLVQDGNNPSYGLTTDANGLLTVKNLEWGSYYLQEIKAPDGYVLYGEKIPFELTMENDAGSALEIITVKNPQKPAKVALTKYEVVEEGQAHTDVKLDGAAFRLYKGKVGSGTYLGTYMTNQLGVAYVDNLEYGDYYFEELLPPQGYLIDNTPIPFTLDETHTSVALQKEATNVRNKGRVFLQKLDDAGDYVKGAKYGFYDKATDALISEHTTNAEGSFEINDLPWGEYYIVETEAPRGYELNTTVYDVVINRETVDNRIIINTNDDRGSGSVELLKVSEENETIKLAGAVFTLYRADGTVFRDNLSTNADGVIFEENIPWGSYYFQEKVAPLGFGLNPDKHRFSISYLTANKTQYITVTDPELSCELMVTKRIKIEDIHYPHGDPTFTFKVVGVATGTRVVTTYYRTMVFSEDYVNAYLQANPGAEYVEQSTVFSNIPLGMYTVTEEDTQRYEFESIEIRKGEGTIRGETVEMDLTTPSKLGDPPEGHVAFTNKKIEQSSTTHTQQQTNIIKMQRKLTGLVAVWNGGDVATETLDRTLLDVYAIYDDGAQVKLADNAYTLDPESFDMNMNGEYVVTVSYTEDGVTRKDTFTLSLSLPTNFTWYVMSSTPFTDTDGTQYDGTASITGYYGSLTTVSFPSWVKGQHETYGNAVNDGKKYKVVRIGQKPEDESPIVGADKMESITVPNGVTEIGDKAFEYAENLSEQLALPESVKTIGEGAFAGSGITGNINLPHVTDVGKGAFADCTDLTGGINLPSLELVREGIFEGCENMRGSVNISGAIEIEARAFYGCTNLTGTINLPLVKKIGTSAFEYATGFTGQINMPVVETIGYSAFYGCTGLTGSVNLPEVTSVAGWAFGDCIGLDGIVSMPKVVTVGEQAFYKCENLTGGISLPKAKTIDKGAFDGCIGLTGGVSLPEVTLVGEYAFRDCKNMTGTISMPKVETVRGYAFLYCEKITGGLSFPKLKTIEIQAFRGLTAATGGINLPMIETIGSSAFEDGENLAGTLQLGTTLTSIDKFAFWKCGKLTGQINIPNVTSIGQSAFYYCSSLTGGLDLSKVETVGPYAFYECGGLDGTLKLNPAWTMIDDWVFSQCVNLKGSLNLTNVKTIGNGAFYHCDSLIGGLDLSTVDTIGAHSFAWCGGMSGVLKLNPAWTEIPEAAFLEMVSITGEINLPNVVTIGNSAFSSMQSITGTINLPKVEVIGDFGFHDLRSATGLSMPKIREVGGAAFWGCYNVATPLSMPDIEVIGSNAFGWCQSMTGVLRIPAGVTIGETAFQYMSSITRLELKSSEHAGQTYGFPGLVSYY